MTHQSTMRYSCHRLLAYLSHNNAHKSHLNSTEMVISITQSQSFFLALRKETLHIKQNRTKLLKAMSTVLPLKAQSTTNWPVLKFFILNNNSKVGCKQSTSENCKGEQICETQKGTKGFNCLIPFFYDHHWQTIGRSHRLCN